VVDMEITLTEERFLMERVAGGQMAEQLISYLRHKVLKLPNKGAKLIPKQKEILDKVFILVRFQTGHDFSQYKHNTILCRIERRMAVNQITKSSDYVRYLQEDHREVDTLFKELLLGVTSFFRDKEAFDVLKGIPYEIRTQYAGNP
jgi:two-component system, chemotaxis family, CheB/CheR fusion protein